MDDCTRNVRMLRASRGKVKSGTDVASGILPDVEGGFQPPGLGTRKARRVAISQAVTGAGCYPPRWKRGSTAGREARRYDGSASSLLVLQGWQPG
jgi:hypothetical protein